METHAQAVEPIEWRDAGTMLDGSPAHYIGDTPVEAWGSTHDEKAHNVDRFARGRDGSYFRFHSQPGAWERLAEVPR